MWDDEVYAFLKEEHSKPFQWGVNDCVQLASRALRQFTKRPVELPRYGSEQDAMRHYVAIRKEHPNDPRHPLEIATTNVLGEPEPQHKLVDCQSGSIVLASFQDTFALGVSWRRYFFVYRVDKPGLMPVDLTLALGYWPCQRFSQL
jgi:hypothetical protein